MIIERMFILYQTVVNVGKGWLGNMENTNSNLTTRQEKLTYSIPEFAGLIGVGRNLVYQLVDKGEIPCLRLGNRKVIPAWVLDRMLEEKA